LLKVNHGMPLDADRSEAMNTFCTSWATPIAATWDRPVQAARSRYGRIRSILRSMPFNRTTGMLLASANDCTARRNCCPICCRHAGDGIGYPRCRRNETTWPPTCSVGTYKFR